MSTLFRQAFSRRQALRFSRSYFSSHSLRLAPRRVGEAMSDGWSTAYGERDLPMNTEAWIVERFGGFHRTLEPGLAFLVPFIDRIAHVQSLKEVAIEIPSQSAITEDNVTIDLDGVLFVKVVDPYRASYGVENHQFAVTQLAQTTMRAEIGQMTLDRTLAERQRLNQRIVEAINSAAADWGIRCLRYEIRDIHPPEKVVEAMHSQVSAERQKRADILQSEGQRQAAINVAEGQKASTILAAEASKAERILAAMGEAESITLKATASAEGIRRIAGAIQENRLGTDAVSMSIAERYLEAFGQVAKKGTTVVLPANVGEPASMVTQALSIFSAVKKSQEEKSVDFPLK